MMNLPHLANKIHKSTKKRPTGSSVSNATKIKLDIGRKRSTTTKEKSWQIAASEYKAGSSAKKIISLSTNCWVRME
jgi:hypothetical protein